MHYFSVAVQQGDRILVTFSKPTLEEAVASAIKDMLYYYTFCSYSDMSFTVDRRCKECNGEGDVPKKRRGFGRKKCPSCKGKNSSVWVLKEVPLIVCDQAKEYISHPELEAH